MDGARHKSLYKVHKESVKDCGGWGAESYVKGKTGASTKAFAAVRTFRRRVDLPLRAAYHDSLIWKSNIKTGVNHEKTDIYQVFGSRRNRGRGRCSARFRRASENEDHAGASLPAAQSKPAVQSERCGGHRRDRRRNHRHRRRRIEGHAGPVRRQIDRPRSAAYRTTLAGHEPGLLLSGGPREDPCHRRARPGVVGHQGEGAGPAGAPVTRRHGAQLLRVLQHGRHHSGHHPGHEHQGTRPRHHRSRLSRLPLRRHGPSRQHHLQHQRASYPSSRRMYAGEEKASAKTATGSSISTSASTSPMPSAAATRSRTWLRSSSKTRFGPKLSCKTFRSCAGR